MIEFVLVLVAAVAAGISGVIISRNLYGNNVIHGKIKNRYDSYILTLEADNKKLTGKLNKMKQGVSISKDDFDEDNPIGSLGGIISQFSHLLPKNLQPLLNDPKTISYVTKLAAENPEKVKELISKFVKKPKGGNDEVSDISSMSV
jgi:hypothetical protein